MSEKKKPTKEKKKLNIVMIDNPEVDRIYSNYVSVTTTPHDCNLTFCHLDPLDRSASQLNAKVVSKIAIPNTLVEELLGIIKLNFDKAMEKIEKSQTKK